MGFRVAGFREEILYMGFFHIYFSHILACFPVFYTHIDTLNPRYIMYMARLGYGVKVLFAASVYSVREGTWKHLGCRIED